MILVFFSAVLIVGALLFAVITMTKGGKRYLDTDKYRSKWLEIEQKLTRDDTASHQLCILNADKLLHTVAVIAKHRQKAEEICNLGFCPTIVVYIQAHDVI